MIKALFIISSFYCLFFTQPVRAQLDTNRRAFSTQALTLVEAADSLWHKYPKQAINFSDSAYLLINELTDKELVTRVIANKGISEYTQGNYEIAIDYYLKAYEQALKSQTDPTEYFLFYLNALLRMGETNKLIRTIDSVKTTITPIDTARLLNINLLALIEIGDISKLEKIYAKQWKLDSPSVYQASFLQTKGKFLQLKSDYEEGKKVLNHAFDFYKSTADSLEMASVMLEKSKLEMSLGNYDSASSLISQSQKLYQSSGYEFGVANTNYQLGILYSDLGQIDLSVENYFNALRIFEALGTNKELAETYLDLAWMYFDSDVNEALELITKALELANMMNNDLIKAQVYNYLGVLYQGMEDYQNALLAFNKSVFLYSNLRLERQIAVVQFNIGTLYEAQGNYKIALDYYLKTYPLDLKLGNELGAGIGEYAIGNAYSMLNKFSLAQKYLFRSKERLELLDAKAELVYCFQYLSTMYERMGLLNRALEFNKRYVSLKDEVYDVQKEARLAELEMRYLLRSKEQEINLLNLENKNKVQELELQESTISNQRRFIIIVSLAVVCFAMLFFFTYRLLKLRNTANRELRALNMEISEKSEEITAQSEEIHEANEEISALNNGLEEQVKIRTDALLKANEELDTFFYHAAHDFRQPLTSFYGLINIGRENIKDVYAEEIFIRLEQTTVSLERMANKLIEMSVLGSEKTVWSVLELPVLINAVISLNESKTNELGTTIEYESKPLLVNTSEDYLKIILKNIIENAIIFSAEKQSPIIRIETSETNEEVVIEVIDNGEGVAKDQKSEIFNMFYRGSVLSNGNGLGLYVAQKAVQKLHGSITLRANDDEGTTFSISLPKAY